MARAILAFVIGALIGAGAGLAAGILVYPRYFPGPVVAPAAGEPAQRPGPLAATGQFAHEDPARTVAGKVRAFTDLVLLEADFRVEPGPDFRVYLVPARNVTALTNVEKTMYVDLGPLRAFRGQQSYAIPAGVDLGEYRTVAIWSRSKGALIAAAELSPN